jgi:hypothetical protein
MPGDGELPRIPGERVAHVAELLGRGAEAPWTPEERAAIISELRRAYPDREIYPCQRGNLANEWANLADAARSRDAYFQASGSSTPPTLAALVDAIRRTRLTRFYPFRGHEYLYFADGPGVWDENGEVAPACIGRDRDEGYSVFRGALGHAPAAQVTRTLTTHDPDEAAAEAERLLAGWAWSGEATGPRAGGPGGIAGGGR